MKGFKLTSCSSSSFPTLSWRKVRAPLDVSDIGLTSNGALTPNTQTQVLSPTPCFQWPDSLPCQTVDDLLDLDTCTYGYLTTSVLDLLQDGYHTIDQHLRMLHTKVEVGSFLIRLREMRRQSEAPAVGSAGSRKRRQSEAPAVGSAGPTATLARCAAPRA